MTAGTIICVIVKQADGLAGNTCSGTLGNQILHYEPIDHEYQLRVIEL